MNLSTVMAGLVLVAAGCSSNDPGVAGARCTPRPGAIFRPLSFAAGGGARSFERLEPTLSEAGTGTAENRPLDSTSNGEEPPCPDPESADGGEASAF
jgi:hypothetical protein